MPRKSRRNPRKRRGRRPLRRRGRARKLAIIRQPRRPGFPGSRITSLRYVGNCVLTPVSGAADALSLRANGCYDPDTRIGGHQPLGFDQWCVLYNRYMVIGSKLTIRCTAASGGPPAQIIAIRATGDPTLALTDYNTMIEQGACKWRLLQPATNGNVVTMRLGFSPRKFWGFKDYGDVQDTYGADAGANPNDPAPLNQAFFVISAVKQDGTVGLATQVLFQIDYKVVFYEPRDLIGS